MGLSNVVSSDSKPQPPARSAQISAEDRRARRRAKITAQVHVRAEGAAGVIEEVGKSIDVSRDGLLFTVQHKEYVKGQIIEVSFPYSNSPGAHNTAQQAEVVRMVPQQVGKMAIAVHFLAAKQAAAGAAKKSEKQASTRSAVAATVTRKTTAQQKESVVLAIETDPKIAEMMRTMLEPDGYTVMIVTTAQEALEVLRTNVPNVFLAEVEAEDMSGQDLCVIIKQNERLAAVPVILLTRSAQPADYSESHKLGAVVCMAKPFQPERLQQVIRLVAPPPALSGPQVARNPATA